MNVIPNEADSLAESSGESWGKGGLLGHCHPEGQCRIIALSGEDRWLGHLTVGRQTSLKLSSQVQEQINKPAASSRKEEGRGIRTSRSTIYSLKCPGFNNNNRRYTEKKRESRQQTASGAASMADPTEQILTMCKVSSLSHT